jgi:hypothetical protein
MSDNVIKGMKKQVRKEVNLRRPIEQSESAASAANNKF